MQVRLWQWQIDRLKAEKCSGAAVIRHAVKRYNRGDFAKCEPVVQNNDSKTNSEKVPQHQLAGYPIKHRFNIPDSVMRNILAWHWSMPDKALQARCDREIKQLDGQINEMFKAYSGVNYILED